MRAALALAFGIGALTGDVAAARTQATHDACMQREMAAHVAADTLRLLYVRGDGETLLRLLCGLRVTSADPADSAGVQHLNVHIGRALDVLRRDSAGAAWTTADTTCGGEVKALTCEFAELRQAHIQAIAAAGSIGLLLTDLLAGPAAHGTVINPAEWNGNGAVSAARVDTVVVIRQPIIVPMPVHVRTEPARRPLAVSGAAGPALVALGARSQLPVIFPVTAALEYLEYMGRPGSVLLSAGMRYRGFLIMPGVSVGAGDPVPWLSVTADTPLGLELGLLVGPALAARVGS